MPTRFVPFGRFEPDIPREKGSTLAQAQNVLPVSRTYRPLQTIVVGDRLVPPGQAINKEICLGAFAHVFSPAKPEQEIFAKSIKDLGDWLTARRDDTAPEREFNAPAWNDVDAIISPSDPVAAVTKFNLTSVNSPNVDGTHTIYYRLWVADKKGTPDWRFTVRIKNGSDDSLVVEEVLEGTAEQWFTTGSFDLSYAQRSAVLDWSNLYVEFEADLLGGLILQENGDRIGSDDGFILQENGDAILQESGDKLIVENLAFLGLEESLQIAAPTGDASRGKWEDEAGGLFNLWQKISGSVDDNTFAISNLLALSASDPYRFTLSTSLSEPVSFDNLRAVVHHYATNAGVDADYKLYTTDDKLIATGSKSDIVIALVTEEEIALTVEGKIDFEDINWADLELEITAKYPGPSSTTSTIWANSRPSVDVVTGDWTATDLFSKLADDNDSTEISAGSSDDSFTIDFGKFNLDADNTEHAEKEITVRSQLTGTTSTRTLRLEVLQNDPEETVATKDFSIVGGAGLTTNTWDIKEETGITDYEELRIKVTAVGSGGTMKVAELTLRLNAARRLVLTKADLWTESDSFMKLSHFVGIVPPKASTPLTDSEDKVSVIVGTQKNLYEVTMERWTELSKDSPSDYSQTPYGWSFAPWGNLVIATNLVDPVQKRDASVAGERFSDLITSSDKPKSQFCAAARDQIFLGDISFLGGERDEVWASAIDNAADFNTTATPANGSIRQRLRDTPGQLTALVGGQVLVIFKRSSIYVGSWVGAPAYWRFDVVSSAIGTDQPRSIVKVDNTIYFKGQGLGDGFYKLVNYQSVVPIGEELRRFAFDEDFSDFAAQKVISQEPLELKSAVIGDIDPSSGLIMWLYRGVEDQAHENSRGIVYNPGEDRMTHLKFANRNVCGLVGVPDLDFTRKPGAILMGGMWTICTAEWTT